MSNRSVQTDALAVLGTIIDDTVGRDAIHLAVEPVTASCRLIPGQNINLAPDGITAVPCDGKGLGIVDPFIQQQVILPGQRFLMVLNPGQIATLRHVWDHPAFPPSQEQGGTDLGVAPAAEPREVAKQWLTTLAGSAHYSFPELINDTLRWSSDKFDEPWWSSAINDETEFWGHIDTYFGHKMPRGQIDLSCRGC